MNIQGTVIIDANIQSFSGVPLHIFLEDIGRIDAPAKIIHKQTLPNISHNNGTQNHITFQFDAGEITFHSKTSLNLRIHVDISGNNEIEKGDLITMQSYPVAGQHDDRIYQIKVNEV